MKKEIVTYIKRGIYEGYYWYSDSPSPNVLVKDFFEFELSDDANPFIIEAQLYDENNNISYSIRYTDGHYLAIRYTLDSTDIIEKDIESFYPNRMNKGKLKFLQKWQIEPDELCEGMDVLVPCERIFIGFEKR